MNRTSPALLGDKDSKMALRSTRQTDKNQTTLDKKVITTKRVAFEEKDKELREQIADEVRKIRQEAVDIEKMRLEIKERDIELVNRIEKLEKKMQEWEESEKERDQWRAEIEARLGEYTADGASGTASRYSGTGNLSRCTSALSIKSGKSATSSFSERDVAQMKRLLVDTERKEKIDIIAIKGLDIDEKNMQANEVVQNMLKDKIKVEVEVKSAWVRGKVIVAKLASVEEKEKVMRNKNKLAGTRIFIENLRNYDERKRKGMATKNWFR